MNKVFLLLGSNIEPRLSFLQTAEHKIDCLIGKITRRSSVYESEPWGFKASRNFLNRVLFLATHLGPQDVLKQVLAVEDEMGRQRSGKGYTSRQIDIDILYFNEDCIDEPGLLVPHPGIPDRRFVLAPMVELEAGFVHPVLQMTQVELLIRCSDELSVWPLTEQNGRKT